MSTHSQDYINNIISEIAPSLKFDTWKLENEKFESIGQNYFSDIVPVTIIGETSVQFQSRMGMDKMNTHCGMLLKLAPTDEKYRVSGAVTSMFHREIFVYSVLFKKYIELQQVVTVCPRFITPKLYFVRDTYCQEVIAMKDMRTLGYKPYTHESFLDLDHVTITLKSLAQLHALSFLLKERDRNLYDEYTNICVPLTEKSNRRYVEIMIDRLTKVLSKFEDTEYVPLLEHLKMNCGKQFDNAFEMAKGTCICHGDMWKENVLFEYDQDNLPISACLIDYQTIKVASPAFDCLYFIISSTDTHLRQEHYFDLVNTYYKTLSDILETIALDPKEVYSKESFDHDLKLVAPACFIMANTALWLSNGLQQEGHVRSKLVLTTQEEKDTAVNKYKSEVKAIMDDFLSYGYLLDK